MIPFIIIYVSVYLISKLRARYTWMDYVAYLILLISPFAMGDTYIVSTLLLTIPTYYILGFNKKEKFRFRNGVEFTIRCKHCRYNEVAIDKTDNINYVYIQCERCGKITKYYLEGKSIKKIPIESDDTYANIASIDFSEHKILVINWAIFLFFIWQPLLNLLPTFIFHSNENDILWMCTTMLYGMATIAFLLLKRYKIAIFIATLFSLQNSSSYSNDILFNFIEQQSYIVNGSLIIAILCLTLPVISKMNKISQVLSLGIIGSMVMYTLYKIAFPTFVGMEYTFTFASYLVRFICVSIILLPTLLALLYAAGNLGTFKIFSSIIYTVGALYFCELLPIPYTTSLYMHIIVTIVYIYVAYNISTFFTNWSTGKVSQMEIATFPFEKILTPNVRKIGAITVCSAILYFVISSVLMVNC